MSAPLRVGDLLVGFCDGHFGRDSFEDKRVEAIGADWAVARDTNGRVQVATFPSESCWCVSDLCKHRKGEPDPLDSLVHASSDQADEQLAALGEVTAWCSDAHALGDDRLTKGALKRGAEAHKKYFPDWPGVPRKR